MPRSAPLFDPSTFTAALNARRLELRISWREVGRQTGIANPTFSRLQQGKLPDINTFAALVRWLGVSADRFLGNPAKGGPAVHPLAALGLPPQAGPALVELVALAQRLARMVDPALAQEAPPR